MAGFGGYLKNHTEALVKDVGIEAAAAITRKSKATLGRYYSNNAEHSDRFMPVDTVAELEAVASYPHVSAALAELHGLSGTIGATWSDRRNEVNVSIVKLSQRFALLMAEYNKTAASGSISHTEAKKLLAETTALQKVLVEMKLHLEVAAS